MQPAARSDSSTSANRTGSRRWRRQYPLVVTSSPPNSPVRLDTSAMRGGDSATIAASASNSSSTGSTSGECAAIEMSRALHSPVSRPSSSMTARTAAGRPEITVVVGVLTAAMPTSPARRATTGATSSSTVNRAAISPGSASDAINRPRAQINRRPSSRLITPATTAATYSPAL